MILERGEQREFFPVKGTMNDDQSVNLSQHQTKENRSCRWTLSLGHFKQELLIGDIQKTHKNKVCLPRSPLKLKKVKPKA